MDRARLFRLGNKRSTEVEEIVRTRYFWVLIVQIPYEKRVEGDLRGECNSVCAERKESVAGSHVTVGSDKKLKALSFVICN